MKMRKMEINERSELLANMLPEDREALLAETEMSDEEREALLAETEMRLRVQKNQEDEKKEFDEKWEKMEINERSELLANMLPEDREALLAETEMRLRVKHYWPE